MISEQQTIHDRANEIYLGWTDADKKHYGWTWQDAHNSASDDRLQALEARVKELEARLESHLEQHAHGVMR